MSLAPMPSPAKKRPISDFFRPYTKSSVPTKRPSPSNEPAPPTSSLSRDVSPTRTPKNVRHRDNGQERTPSGLLFSPLSTPGSRASLPIRSPHPKSGLRPATTYKEAPRFGPQAKNHAATKPSSHSFNFADLPGSTQTVVKGGKVVEVRGSDEDTDSLVSLDDILGSRETEQVTSCSSSPDIDEDRNEAERIKTLSLFTRGRSDPLVGKDKLRALYAQQNARKFDIQGILGDHFDDQETEEKVKKAENHYEESTKPQSLDRKWEVDRNLLAAVAMTEDGDDGVSRLLTAVRRQEVLNTDKSFSFFGRTGVNDWTDEPPPVKSFPLPSIPHGLWRAGDDGSRSRAYLSGHMVELAARSQLDDPALRWTFQNVVTEPHDAARQAYINCLSKASAAWTRTNISTADVNRVFQTLGAELASLQDSGAIEPRHYSTKEPNRRDSRYLLAALDLFRAIAQDMDFAALGKLTSTTCRLAIDQQLMSDGLVAGKVEELLSTILSFKDTDVQSHVVERMLNDVGRHLQTPLLQAQLLAHIAPVSPTACRTRITLAQQFLFGAETLETKKLDHFEVNLDSLTKLIANSPSFNTSRHKSSDPLDYVSLRSSSYLLDVAISDGGRPGSFLSHSEENAFNRAVDRLADAVRSTFIAIVDTGASHMSRTEAKDVLQALHFRLLYSVRTEVRPKKNIFDEKTRKTRDGGEVRAEDRGRSFLKNFLDRQKDKGKEADNSEIAASWTESPATDGHAQKSRQRTDASLPGTKRHEVHNTHMHISRLPGNTDRDPHTPANDVSAITASSGTSPVTSDTSQPSETEKAIRMQLGLA
ncbi:hypothetical protein LTR84_000550 [Exophiala bonariae]|uniref:Uncharacterized protein n=1 Tax=Exophiala bonariae TaxID=1690606 RepID=A0AAV9NQV6_9EURO|nr:hypothetical protein LTR84_000550 [Exophiala bonariae]